MIVLIGSLISTVVVAFTIIMRTLEEYCHISTSEPNKHAIGDNFTSAAIESTVGGTSTSTRTAETRASENAAASDPADRAARAARSASGRASTDYVDFENDASAADGADDGAVMGAVPFRGTVVLNQANECAIEMQSVPKMPPSIGHAAPHMIASTPHREPPPLRPLPPHAISVIPPSEVRTNHDMQLAAALAGMQSQLAAITAQLSALAADTNHKIESQDQIHRQMIHDLDQQQQQQQQLMEQSLLQMKQWIIDRESRDAAGDHTANDSQH